MTMEIDVTGIDTWELLAALHNHAKVPPTAVCMMQARGDVTACEVRKEAQAHMMEREEGSAPFWPDYVFGRPIKAYLTHRSDNRVILFRTDLYDRSAGEGTAARAVHLLKAQGVSA